jgi:hypothetical protein
MRKAVGAPEIRQNTWETVTLRLFSWLCFKNQWSEGKLAELGVLYINFLLQLKNSPPDA